MALRRYFEAHLAIKLEQVKQSLQRTEGGILVHPQPPYKVSSMLQDFNMVVAFFQVNPSCRNMWMSFEGRGITKQCAIFRDRDFLFVLFPCFVE